MNKITPSSICKIMIILFVFLLGTSMLSSAQWNDEDIRRVEQEHKKEGRGYAFSAIITLAAWAGIGIWLKKRQLNRTNKFGTQEFSSTGSYFKAGALEGLANVAAVLLFIGSLLFILVAITKCN